MSLTLVTGLLTAAVLPVLEPLSALPGRGIERDFILACARAAERQVPMTRDDSTMLFRPDFQPVTPRIAQRFGLQPNSRQTEYAYTHLFIFSGESWHDNEMTLITCEAAFDPLAPRFPQVWIGVVREP